MRKRIYEIIEKADSNDKASSIYDISMLFIIVVSLIPLFFKKDNAVFFIIDKVSVVIFIIDYLLRWITADYKNEKSGKASFIAYPFTFMAIIDLLSILPSLSIINKGFKALRVLRMIRALRVVRVFKIARYSKSFKIIANVLKNSRAPLLAVCVLAFGYIIISALIIYNVEPDTFDTYFDALYWATVSLTTVGYGDIYPVSILGRIITMISSIFGIAIVALPAGIITAGYMNEIGHSNIDENKDDEDII
ncbi:voltage-gated potassium channel [Lachnospiraceae bacterium]|nr:voltage-gated potassium channel [Lachnospiraceae bacterium]